MRLFVLALIASLAGSSLLAQTNYLPATGNVGVGTSNLNELFNVGNRFAYHNGNEWWDALLFNGWWDSSSAVWRTRTSGPTGIIFWDNYSGGFHYYFGDSQQSGAPTYPHFRFALQSDGKIGIGTQSPQAAADISRDSGDLLRFTHGNNVNYWMAVQSYVVGPANIGYKYKATNNGVTTDAMVITGEGKIGIGELNPFHKLSVNGAIKAKEVIVETTGWSDYVLADEYALAPLAEVEAHIKEHKHLPGIPSAAQIADQGVSIGEMQAKLLAKIEELTLHVIAQEKRLSDQENELRLLKTKTMRSFGVP